MTVVDTWARAYPYPPNASSACNCEFAALAQTLNTRLVTMDKLLLRAFRARDRTQRRLSSAPLH